MVAQTWGLCSTVECLQEKENREELLQGMERIQAKKRLVFEFSHKQQQQLLQREIRNAAFKFYIRGKRGIAEDVSCKMPMNE